MTQMGRIEKWIVNSRSHSRRVSRHAARRLETVNVHPGQKYLDVGCGNGAAAIEIALRYSLEVTGIDVDPEQIRLAEESHQGINHVRFLTADATHLPFSDGEFDIVAANKLTHHILNWEDALAEIIRVLKPKGHLVYADIVLPQWLASIGRTVLGTRAGFPTARALDALLTRHDLVPVRVSRSWGHYEAVAARL